MVPPLREGEFGIIEGLMRDSWPLRSKRHLAGADHGHICSFCVYVLCSYTLKKLTSIQPTRPGRGPELAILLENQGQFE